MLFVQRLGLVLTCSVSSLPVPSLVRFKGDEARANNIYSNVEALKADDIADLILYCMNTPKRMNLHEVVVMPSVQASVRMVKKKDGSIIS